VTPDWKAWLPLFGVGIAVGVAMGVAFASPLIGVGIGFAVCAALFWEQRLSRRR
jgi:hypothetical protein